MNIEAALNRMAQAVEANNALLLQFLQQQPHQVQQPISQQQRKLSKRDARKLDIARIDQLLIKHLPGIEHFLPQH